MGENNSQFGQPIPQPSVPVAGSPYIPPQTPQLPPVQPVQNSEFNKKRVISIAVVIFFILFGLVAFRVIRDVFYLCCISEPGTGNAPSIVQKIVKTDLSRFDQDTDSDGYPDFIETELDLDPNVSEEISCRKGGCSVADSVSSESKKHNVLIILDASGSMALGGTPNRMEIAKTAIKSYVNRASGDTQIGLMIYGHKGSNSAGDKATSCATAEVVAPIGTINQSSIDGALETVRPVGWTLMGRALNEAGKVFVGKENDNNEVILLSDGEETCNSNPTGEATLLKNSAQKVTINVIGFAVDSNAQTQLNQISSNGGGTFSLANNLTELDRKFAELYENGLKRYQDLKCNLGNFDEFRACYQSGFDKVIGWVNKRKLLLYDKKITQDEYNKLDNLGSALYKQRTDVIDKEQKLINDKFKK